MSPKDTIDTGELRAATREAEEAADRMARAFDASGEAIARSLERAGRSGSLSIQSMVEEILQSLARLAVDQLIIDPLSGLFAQAGRDLGSVIGQRAEGGPVLAGQSYLVGERGPEVFTPGQGGAVSPMAGLPPIHITIHAGADTAASVRRSESQIAASLARAVRAGADRL